MNPRLVINLEKLTHNAKYLNSLCKQHGISMAAVTKVFCADARMVEVLVDAGVDHLADSRIENIAAYPKTFKGTKMLLRLPSPAQAADVVRLCDISLNSEIAALRELSAQANKQGKVHGVVVMIDLGDLREGIYHTQIDDILELCSFVHEQEHLQLHGIGTNLTCYGSVLPSVENMGRLANIAQRVKAELGVDLPIVSGGNSSSLPMLAGGKIPQKINHLRIGEAIVCGLETAYGEPFPGLQQNVIILEATIIEIAKKPSMPEGQTNINAFGEKIEYTDSGEHLRAICAVGRQDTSFDGLTPMQGGVAIIGGSSDHLIVDITHAEPLSVGDVLTFGLSYGAILTGFTSKYVDRIYT